MSPGPAEKAGPLGKELLRQAASLVFVEDVEIPDLSEEDRHHLADVLRLDDGEVVVVSDGAGHYRSAVVSRPALVAPSSGARAGRRGRAGAGLELQALGPVQTDVPAHWSVTVGFCLQKGERSEWTVQKLTELGVDRIVPLVSERTIVRLDAAERERRAARLRRIAREAAAQSRRVYLPEVTTPLDLARFAATEGPLVLAEPGGAELTTAIRALVVGPEGGFSDDELGSARATVDLGKTILRAETAAIVAATLLVHLRAHAALT